MKDTCLTGSSEEEYGESRLRHVFGALEDRCMRPSVANEYMTNLVSILHALCYEQALFDSW